MGRPVRQAAGSPAGCGTKKRTRQEDGGACWKTQQEIDQLWDAFSEVRQDEELPKKQIFSSG